MNFLRDDFNSSYNVPISSGSHMFGDFLSRGRCLQDSVLTVDTCGCQPYRVQCTGSVQNSLLDPRSIFGIPC